MLYRLKLKQIITYMEFLLDLDVSIKNLENLQRVMMMGMDEMRLPKARITRSSFTFTVDFGTTLFFMRSMDISLFSVFPDGVPVLCTFETADVNSTPLKCQFRVGE